MIPAIPYRYRVLAFICSLTTLTYLDRICISIVGVRLKADLHLTNEEFGWVLASFALAYALFEIPSGAWGDRIGPRAVFIRIVLWWSFFTMMTGLVNGLLSLLVMRFLFGMGESGTMPNNVLVISRWFPADETGRALPWMGIGTQIGAAIAPLLIIPIAQTWGWRTPFFVNGMIGFLWVLLCFSWFRNFPSEMKNISPEEVRLIESSRRYSTTHSLIPWKIIFRNRTLWALMGMYFCYQWANYFFVAWSPVYLQEKLHFTEKQTQPIIFLLFVVGIIGLLWGGYCIDWMAKKKGLLFGRRFIGILGIGGCGLCFLLAILSTSSSVSAGAMIAANGFYSFGVMASFAVCTDIGRNNAGTVTGAMNFSGQFGAFFLSLVVGKMVELTHNFNKPLIIVVVAQFIGMILWFIIDPTRPMDLQKKEPEQSPALSNT
jgi:MFS transporter, ACS family, glucarate transporter